MPGLLKLIVVAAVVAAAAAAPNAADNGRRKACKGAQEGDYCSVNEREHHGEHIRFNGDCINGVCTMHDRNKPDPPAAACESRRPGRPCEYRDKERKTVHGTCTLAQCYPDYRCYYGPCPKICLNDIYYCKTGEE